MTASRLKLAPGVAEVIAQEQAFASPQEAAAFWNVGSEEVEVRDLSYPGADGQEQAVRLYLGGVPQSATLVYIHGGGWAGGSIDLHDRSARGLSVQGACNVVSVSYRLAPKHPYPAGLNDCLAAVDWVKRSGASLGLNTEKMAIGGASAGGNLASAAALARPNQFTGLLVFYGVLGCDLTTKSYLDYTNGPGLTRARMAALFDMYDPDGRRTSDPLITPLVSEDLSRLPPTSIIAAEHDVLLDDNRAFAAALERAGVLKMFHTEPGVTHGFINRGRLVDAATTAILRAAGFLRDL